MVTIVRGRDTKEQIVYRPGGERHESPTSEWVPTTCRMCLVGCALLVKVESGKVVNVIGNPDSPKNRGRMCAKGKSGIMNHYNPDRLTHPIKRTNPQKGLGVDPKWAEISWEEAIDTVSKKLKKALEEDPLKVYFQLWGSASLSQWLYPLIPVAGTPYAQGSLSGTCGKTIHSIQYLTQGGVHQEPDYEYATYVINVGTQQGIATREGFNHTVPDCAAARERGMKLVVVDPIGNNSAAKADEWLPIRPGTDAAFALGMLNQLLNELKIYDTEYLKNNTNAGYLVGANKKYIRDRAMQKPQLYDLSDGKVKTYDDPTLKDPAIEGEYEVDGQNGKPAFELLKDRVAKYPPERVEEITTIPANKLQRISREFGEAAHIGATIVIDGVTLPYRPVALEWCRGPQGHKHAWAHTWALHLVNLVLGAIDVVGSLHSTEVASNWPTKRMPEAGQDGMVGWTNKISDGRADSFPGRPASRPDRIDLFELFPVAGHTRTTVPIVHKDPKKYGVDHHPQIELLIHSAGNYIMGGFGEINAVVDWYKSIDTMVGFARELNEMHEFDDIVLPLPTYLEEDVFGGSHGTSVCGEAVGFQQIQQQVVDLPEGVRPIGDVWMEIFHRIGILDEVYFVMNRAMGLKPPYLLEPGKRYTGEQVLDKQAKSSYGEEHGWDWFKENGVLVHTRDVDERYPGRFIKARVPIYLEHFTERGEELEAVLGEMGLDWDLSDYEPVPEWRPCHAFEEMQKQKCDAIAVHYKLPYVYGQHGNANPWVDELCEKLPHSYGVLINTKLARGKGIKDGDSVWLESPVAKTKAVARVTEMVHPEVVGIAGQSGHWAKGKPVSQGKGVNFMSLMPYELEDLDVISSATDFCAPLKVYKA